MMENDNADSTVRQIYSNLKNDHVDVVAGNVTKIGEAAIPHVSEALKMIRIHQMKKKPQMKLYYMSL